MSFLPDEKTIREKRPLFCLPMGFYENMGSRTTETKLLLRKQRGNAGSPWLEHGQTGRAWAVSTIFEPLTW